MNSYMVVATFKADITQDEIRALIPAEQIQAKVLEEQGIIGAIKIAMPKRTVFIEAFGEDDQNVLESIKTLPLSTLWNIELFPTPPPAGSRV